MQWGDIQKTKTKKEKQNNCQIQKEGETNPSQKTRND